MKYQKISSILNYLQSVLFIVIASIAFTNSYAAGSLYEPDKEFKIVDEKKLPYPEKVPNAKELAYQVNFVNHFYSFENYSITKTNNLSAAIVIRKKGSKKPLIVTFERYINNNVEDNKLLSKDLSIFRSGKLKNTALMITDYDEKFKKQLYEVFVPSIRKIRRFSEPEQGDSWSNSDLTFGDIMLRKPEDEDHEFVKTSKFNGCLNTMFLPKKQRNKYIKKMETQKDCSIDGKLVYELKSTPKEKNGWYDYRISYINIITLADQRVEFFKNGKKIKVIDKSWRLFKGLRQFVYSSDKRNVYINFWYAKNLLTGSETLVMVPDGLHLVNHDFKTKNLWTTNTLKKIPKKIH